jgi:hypothetical protein
MGRDCLVSGFGARSIDANNAESIWRDHSTRYVRPEDGPSWPRSEDRAVRERSRSQVEMSWRDSRVGEYQHKNIPLRWKPRLRQNQEGRVYVREGHRRSRDPGSEKREEQVLGKPSRSLTLLRRQNRKRGVSVEQIRLWPLNFEASLSEHACIICGVRVIGYDGNAARL